MRRKKIILFQCLFLMATISVLGQVKLNELTDFMEPRGDWFETKFVKLDSVNNKLFNYESGKGYFVNGHTGKTEDLITKEAYGDIELHIEFLVPKGSNSGIFFQNRYEVQILDSYGEDNPEFSDCGGIYQRWDENSSENQKGYEGVPPRVNACLPLGQYQTFNIIFRAPIFDGDGKKIKNALFEKIVLNGIVIHKNIEVTGPTRDGIFGDEQAFAPLRLQGDHGLVAFRNIRVRTLDNIRPTKKNEWVDLFEETKNGPNYDFIVQGNATQKDADSMFEFDGEVLKAMYKWQDISAPFGIAVTKKVYSSYDLKLEFKWGERRFKPRLEVLRDAGLLFHCQTAGFYLWSPSLEFQIQEGDCGDLWCTLGAMCDVLKDGEILKLDISDYSRSEKWTNEEKPGWNKVLIEVREDKAKYYLNGVLVNEIVNATYGGLTCKSGFIGLQAEGAEVEYRNIKIREL